MEHHQAFQEEDGSLACTAPRPSTFTGSQTLDLTVSQVAADILERGLKERAKTAGLGLLGPAVERVVKRKIGRMSDRLAHLIARTALESATARRLVFQLLVRQLTTDEARRLNQAAWTGSVDSLRKPSEGLREILGPRANTPEPP